MLYITKPIYDEYKENISYIFEDLLFTDCPFAILTSLGYLCGALSYTFDENSDESISVDIDELEQYLLQLQKAIVHLEHFTASQKASTHQIYNKYLILLKACQKHLTESLQ